MKQYLSLFVVACLCLALCSCGEQTLEGIYMNADGEVIEFKEDGSCIAFYNGIQLSGTYWKSEDCWKMRIGAGVFYNEHDIEKNGRNLIIDDDLYIKQ